MAFIRNHLNKLGTERERGRETNCVTARKLRTDCSERKAVTAISAQSACFNSGKINSRHFTSATRVQCQDRLCGICSRGGTGGRVSTSRSARSFVENTTEGLRVELLNLCGFVTEI